MANTNANKLSASHIRYLLVLKKLAASDLGVRSVTLAEELGISKPSVCNMLCVLSEMKLVDKQPRSIVYLTQAGNQMAEKYSEYYDAVFTILTKYISPNCIAPEAVCSLIAGMTEDSLEELCFSITNKANEAKIFQEENIYADC